MSDRPARHAKSWVKKPLTCFWFFLLGVLVGGLCMAWIARDTLVSRAELPATVPSAEGQGQIRSDAASAQVPLNSPSATATSSKDQAIVKKPGETYIALVLDDCGSSLALAEKVQALGLPLTWAIIPHLKFSGETAALLRKSDIPFLVHVPMQALVDPDGKAGEKGPYYIGAGMTEEEAGRVLLPLIESLPGAYGINNHRGSKATADETTMRGVMKTLASREMFFLDSNTSPKTVAYKVAADIGLPTAKNGHFLDNESDREKIAGEFERAVKISRQKGNVVAICHLRSETIVFLENLSKQDLQAKGIRLVTLPQLMKLQKGD